MGRRENIRSCHSLLRILTITSVCSCILNLSVLIVCLCTGRWIFGNVLCQGFAFVSHLLVGGAAWLIALAGLERYYKLFVQAEHPCVFSDINTRLLVIGIYFLVAAVLSNPLYGWGEFSQYKGYFHFTILLSNVDQVADNDNGTTVDNNTFTINSSYVDNITFLVNETFTHNNSLMENNSLIENIYFIDNNSFTENISFTENKSFVENDSFVVNNSFIKNGYFMETDSLTDNSFVENFNQCLPVTNNRFQMNAHINFSDFEEIIRTGLQTSWRFEPRVLQTNGNNLTYLLRSASREDLADFLGSYVEGSLGRRLVSHMFSSCDCAISMCGGFYLDKMEVQYYQQVYMTFQDPMVCSVDFTSANQYTGYFVIFFLLTMSVFPCVSILVLASITALRWCLGSVDTPLEEWKKSRNIFVGGLFSVLFCIPYFVFNVLNISGLTMSLQWHTAILVLLYTSCLVPCVLSFNIKCMGLVSDPSPTSARKPIYLNNVDFELLQPAQDSDHMDPVS